MDGGFVARFAVEIAFLGLLALAAGLAELDTPWIVVVMAGGWLLIVVVEWLAWRTETADEGRLHPPAAPDPPDDEPTDGWDIEEILAPLPESREAGTPADAVDRPAGER